MAAAETAIEIRLLGEFRVLAGDRDIPPGAWEHRRSADLVKLLALCPEHRLVREQVLEALWPHLDPEAAGAALHKAASLARKVLGLADGVVLRGGEVALAPGTEVLTDVARFELAARQALAGKDPRAAAAAASRYPGDLLPADRYAPWAGPVRDRLVQTHLELLRQAGAWEEIVARDPLDERAQVGLMRLYAEAGNRAAALQQFRRLRKLLADELGVGPPAEAAALYETLCRGPAVQAPVAASGPLVGRQVELARARTLLRKVAEGQGHTLMVRGDAGIGKTRFCETVLVEAAQAGTTTLRGSTPQDEPGAYAPVVEALDRLLLARPDLAALLREPARQVLARLATATPAVPGDGGAPIGRQQVLSAVGQLLTLTTKERPVVLFLDDIHHADDSTVGLVFFLAELARFHPLLLLLATRCEDRPALGRARASLLAQRAASELDLGPLGFSECSAIIDRIAEDRASPELASAIHARAAGNPLFTELLASAAEPAEGLPPDLEVVLTSHLARAGQEVLDLLRRIAVLGNRFSAEELLLLGGVEEDKAFALLDRALGARLVDEAAGTYHFHHALFGETLLQAMPGHRRKAAHRAAARALSATGAPASRIAHQLLAAEAPAQARPWLVQAAEDEARVSAYASALGFVELALKTGPAEARLLALEGQLRFATGDPSAPACYQRALDLAAEGEKPELRVQKAQAELSGGDVAAASQTLAGLLPPQDLAVRVRYLVVRGEVDWMRGDLAAAEEATQTARTLAEENGILGELVEAVMARGLVAHSRGGFLELARADLLKPELAPALSAIVHEGHLCVTEGYLSSGQPYEAVARFARELRAAGERSGARRAVAFATCLLGETELLTGALESAARLLDEAAQLNLRLGAKGAAALARQRQAEAALAAGDLAGARSLLAEALALARETPFGQRHLLLRVYGTRIQAERTLDQALAVVDEAAVGIVGPGESCNACHITFVVPAAIACARAGQRARAEGQLAMAEQTVQFFFPKGPWQAALDEIRGELARAAGAWEAATAHFAQAGVLYGAAGQRLDAERCRRTAENPSISSG